MDLFLLKKIITVLIMPINIVLLLLIFSLVFHRKKPKHSFKSLSAAFIILLVSSFAPFSDTVMTAIENDYPPYVKTNVPIDYILVLGCRHNTNAELPATSQLKSSSLERLVEAVRIYRLHPEAQVITSGYAGNDENSNAEKVKQAAIILGIPKHKILTENFPQDTQEEAQLIAPRVLNRNVVLVTSASHLPRAMAYFQQYGIKAIPAPASPWVKSEHYSSWTHYMPNAQKLQQTTNVWYETLGRVVQWLKS